MAADTEPGAAGTLPKASEIGYTVLMRNAIWIVACLSLIHI